MKKERRCKTFNKAKTSSVSMSKSQSSIKQQTLSPQGEIHYQEKARGPSKERKLLAETADKKTQ